MLSFFNDYVLEIMPLKSCQAFFFFCSPDTHLKNITYNNKSKSRGFNMPDLHLFPATQMSKALTP